MGVDFSLWLSDTAAIPASGRAAAAWARINDKPTSVTFRKPDGTDLDAQTVRLEYDSRVSESESPAGQTPVRKLIIFGVKDHDTVTDTDIGEGSDSTTRATLIAWWTSFTPSERFKL